MAHAANVTGEVSADFAALRTKANMNLYAPNKLILLKVLDILADKTAQANVMDRERHEPHPVGDFVTVCSRVRLDDQAFLQQFGAEKANCRILTWCWLAWSMDFSGYLAGF